MWTPTDRSEMCAFLGLSILMRIVYKPWLSMYWSSDLVYKTGIFGDAMARDRFLLLLRFLHFADNDALDARDPDRDRLAKICPLINLIRDRCAAVYSPGKDLCVDESLVLFEGWVAFKQFTRTKRARFGIKLFELCTSNGVLLDFMTYHERMSDKLLTLPNHDVLLDFMTYHERMSDKLLTLPNHDVLLDVMTYHERMSDKLLTLPNHDFLTSDLIPLTMLQRYLNKGHRLFVDNYYTTPTMAQYLLEHGTKLVGTARTNRRNFQRELDDAEIGKGGNPNFRCRHQVSWQ